MFGHTGLGRVCCGQSAVYGLAAACCGVLWRAVACVLPHTAHAACLSAVGMCQAQTLAVAAWGVGALLARSFFRAWGRVIAWGFSRVHAAAPLYLHPKGFPGLRQAARRPCCHAQECVCVCCRIRVLLTVVVGCWSHCSRMCVCILLPGVTLQPAALCCQKGCECVCACGVGFL